MTAKSPGSLAILLAFAAFTCTTLAQQPQPSPPPPPDQPQPELPADAKPHIKEGSVAPAFTIKTMSGKDIKFPADYKGKAVLLSFWASTSKPSRHQGPKQVAAYAKLHDQGFEIIGVCLDKARGIPLEQTQAFMKEVGIDKWENVYDDAAKVSDLYSAQDALTLYLVNGNTGKVVAKGDMLKGDVLITVAQRTLAAMRESGAGDKPKTPDRKETPQGAQPPQEKPRPKPEKP